MSLVNEMLRDLDARRDRLSVDSALNGLNPAPIEHGQPAYVHWLVVPLLAVIVGIAGWFMVAQYSDKPAIPEAYIAVQPVTPEPVIEPVTRAAIEKPATSITEAPAQKPIVVEAPIAVPDATPAEIEEQVVETPTAPTITKKPRILTPAEQSEQLYAEALTASKAGDTRRVESLLTEAIALSPDHVRAREQLAITLIMQQRQREAEQVLADGLAIDPTQVNMALQLGQMLAQQGKENEAIRVMEPALLNGADNPQFLGTLAGVYQNAGKSQLAINNYQAALSLRPGQNIWWMGLGIALEQSGQFDKATDAYQQALNKGLRPDLRNYVSERLAVLQPAAGTQ